MTASPALLYSIQRLLLLIAVGAPMYLVGMRGFWLLATAFVLSGLISLFVLRRQRDQVSIGLTSRLESWNAKIDKRAAAEDLD